MAFVNSSKTWTPWDLKKHGNHPTLAKKMLIMIDLSIEIPIISTLFSSSMLWMGVQKELRHYVEF